MQELCGVKGLLTCCRVTLLNGEGLLVALLAGDALGVFHQVTSLRMLLDLRAT